MKKTRWLALGAGVLVASVGYRASTGLELLNPNSTNPSEEISYSAGEYGFDRLADQETFEEGQWLPAVEVSDSTFSRSGKGQLFDLSFDDYQSFLGKIHLVQDPGKVLPLTPQQELWLLRHEDDVVPALTERFQLWSNFREISWSAAELPKGLVCTSETESVIVPLRAEHWPAFRPHLPVLDATFPLVILFFGEELPMELRQYSASIIQLRGEPESLASLGVEALYSAVALSTADGQVRPAMRMGEAPPESVGIDREALADIDRLMERAIRRKATPGGQMLIAKEGKIVYNRGFGFHTYAKEEEVRPTDLYDLASITKVAATTLALMALEEEGYVDLADRVGEYLPEYKRYGVRYLRLRHLLSHHSGLQANLPLAKWLREKDLFSTTATPEYSIAVDQDCYLRKDVPALFLEELKRMRPSRRSRYRYSDVHFVLLQQLIERQRGQNLDEIVEQDFYAPLGLSRLGYRPGLRIPASEIVPTEKDPRWRGGIVRGEVHDESALLMGGVGGHAGLFSNSRDLAILFQMLLNEGEYGGQRFFEPETIQTFTKRNNYNYRGHGFDRLAGHSKALRYYGASLATFGHTGFTGTCVWADPENELIFIFLSNRIHPDPDNERLLRMGLRERLHKVVYKSLDTFVKEV